MSLVAATAIWLPLVHLLFAPSPSEGRVEPGGEVSPRARALFEQQLALWESERDRGEALALLRTNNPEWDLMSRTFFVLAAANMALREPDQQARSLAAIDRAIDGTLERRRRQGFTSFLLDYWQRAPFVSRPARSLFVEGELTMMLAVRQLIDERSDYRPLLARQLERVIAQMEAGPVLSGESYPDECWTVCNSFALAAIRIADLVQGEDHSDLLERWLAMARQRLIDRPTGMLVSEYTVDGQHLDGPEGSSIFLVAHLLELIDEDFAHDQYDRARQALGADLSGFAWAQEWPGPGPTAVVDIDSGPTIPLLGANAGASGMAILGAATFGDEQWLRGLLTSLDFAAFPIDVGPGRLRYGASNQVGDAVLLYALVQGPLWAHVRGELLQQARRT